MKNKVLIVGIWMLCFACALFLAACGTSAPVTLVVVNGPKTLTVLQGSQPDYTDGVAEVTYEDGSVKEISMTELATEDFDPEKTGKQTVTLVYAEGDNRVTTTIDLTVAAPKVTKIEANTENLISEYVEGQTFRKDSIVVTAYFNNGKESVLSEYEIAPKVLTASTEIVKITYRGAKVEIPVIVEKKQPKTLTLFLDSEVVQTEYVENTPFKQEGITGKVTFNDDTEQSFTTEELRFLHQGNETAYDFPMNAEDNVVRVIAHTDWGDIEATLSLDIKERRPILLKLTQNVDFSFTVGDLFSIENAEDVSLYVKYNDGTDRTLDGLDLSLSYSDDPVTLEDKTWRIWVDDFDDLTESVSIEVKPSVVQSISVSQRPDKKSYGAQETELDPTGLIVDVIWTGGPPTQVTWEDEGVVCTPMTLTAETDTITVTYGGQSTTFEIYR